MVLETMQGMVISSEGGAGMGGKGIRPPRL